VWVGELAVVLALDSESWSSTDSAIGRAPRYLGSAGCRLPFKLSGVSVYLDPEAGRPLRRRSDLSAKLESIQILSDRSERLLNSQGEV
jgi:hypothetical protein